MGSRGSSTQTVGYRYSLGAHLALCHGPVDTIREIRVDDRIAWSLGDGTVASSGAGAGVGATQTIGTFSSAAAFPSDEMGSTAQLNVYGSNGLSGFSMGQVLDLALQSDGVSHRIILRGIAHDEREHLTWMQVEPKTLSFAAQPVTITTAASGSVPVAEEAPASGTRIRIDKPDLFGGESREGGIVGDIDVLLGAPDQGQNDYLAARVVGSVPGFRGLCSLVLRQVYLGLNPYLKPWAVRLTRILTAGDGVTQWYPEMAQIVPAARIGDAAIYIAMDVSNSMAGSKLTAQFEAVAALVAEIGANASAPNDLCLVTYAGTVRESITQRDADSTAYADLTAWIEALPTSTAFGTDYGAAVSEAPGFFAEAGSKRRLLLFVTDGAPTPASSLGSAQATLAAVSDVEVFAFNIALSDTSATGSLDNTPIDGVPVIPAGDAGVLVASMRAAFGKGPDMNPAHIIRECLTNRTWGLGYGETDMGASFTGAADQLFSEGFGLSLLWQTDASLEEFIGDILTHIDAYLHVDRRTGLWELRLIRDDYDPDTLPVFDETNVIDWGALGRREAADLVNSVTVTFSDARTDQTGSVSVTDTARVQMMGQVIATTVDYPGIRFEDLAVRIAERDLRGLSAPLLSGEITVNRQGAALDPGDVIRLVSARRGLEGIVVRVVEIDHGDGRANGVRLRIVEDAFALGDTALVGGDTATSPSLIAAPKPLARRMVQEAPYWLLVQELGHTQADAELVSDPDAGALMATGERPSSDALATQVWIDAGTGYAADDPTGFVPIAILDADVIDDPEETVIAVRDWTGIAELVTGTLAAIGAELVRIDGITGTSITVGRGCLDTVPMAHPADTPVIFWQSGAQATRTSFLAGETVSVKLLSQTGYGTLPLSQAPTDTVTLASRAIRPLPPGNLRGDGGFSKTLASPETALSWSHRDRLSQTSVVFDDYLAADIGPEPNASYEIRIHWVDADTEETLEPAAVVIDAGQANNYSLTDADYPQPPIGVEMAAIRVRSVRDGHEDRAFREYRVSLGGKVQITDQDLTIFFTGPGVDITAQDLILSCTGPGVDLIQQDLILDLRPPELGVIGQELVTEIIP
jgi:uncharacterized protein YegL